MKVIAVIGAMYGDEGKGLMVDYLARNLIGATVVRFQGGAQAGHTVVDPDTGEEHIFSHFGSGSLAGASTILSSNFVCNPNIFLKEAEELKKKKAIQSLYGHGNMPSVYIDGRSPITTPFEVILNRAIEDSRGESRHGSVGIGFGETIERESAGVSLLYKHLSESTGHILIRLFNVYDFFLERAKKLDLLSKPVVFSIINNMEEVIREYSKTMISFRKATMLGLPGQYAKHNIMDKFISEDGERAIILEGSQGLKLDMRYGDFPHVTRSRTGLVSAMNFCDEIGVEITEAIYVTRFYTTRHGNGPLRQESNFSKTINDQFNGMLEYDTTNKSNLYQGKLRVAPFDYAEIQRLIKMDVDESMYKGKVSQAITWLDWMGILNDIPIVGDSNSVRSSEGRSVFMDRVVNNFNYMSFGRTHKTIFTNR